jgi:hypothetical protein
LTGAVIALAMPSLVEATEVRVGGSLGFGGAGISTSVLIDGVSTPASLAESPGTASIWAEMPILSAWTIGVEHSRGVSFGPISAGVSFTGITGKWYFLSPIPSVAARDQSSVQIRQWSPYVGLSAGAAFASVARERSKVSLVEGSGAYFGLSGGVDYPLWSRWAIRPEFTSAFTLFSSVVVPTTITYFSIQCSIYTSF